jgi:hypothetical protein
MTFDEVLAHVLDLLQREGRLSYRAQKRRFALDDGYLEDLKAEIIQAKRMALAEDGVVLAWVGTAPTPSVTRGETRSSAPPDAPAVRPTPPAAGHDRATAERRHNPIVKIKSYAPVTGSRLT